MPLAAVVPLVFSPFDHDSVAETIREILESPFCHEASQLPRQRQHRLLLAGKRALRNNAEQQFSGTRQRGLDFAIAKIDRLLHYAHGSLSVKKAANSLL
jgi:hypothetical protein